MMTLVLALALQEEFTCKDGFVLKYKRIAPERAEKDAKVPLALCLHGKGGKSDAAIELAKPGMRRKYPCYILAPSVDTKVYSWAGGRKPALPYVFELVEALKKAGGQPKYTEYPGVKHNSWDRAYADDELWTWMFEQKRKE